MPGLERSLTLLFLLSIAVLMSGGIALGVVLAKVF